MSPNEFITLVSNLGYKKGYDFFVRSDGGSNYEFRIISSQPDAMKYKETGNTELVNVTSGRIFNEFELKYLNESDVLKLIMHTVLKYEEHEAFEFLTYKSKQLVAAHDNQTGLLK